MQFRHHRLDNGLTVIAECNPNAYSVALGFFVNAGSRDETEEISGVSHFLEHMAFKGTPNRSADDVNRELDEMGSSSNARTSEERTIYHATVLPEFQNRMVELLADILRPSLRDDDFEMEKQVIIEEIHMYEDQPPFGGHERIMANFFGKHSLGKSVLGTEQSVGAMTPTQMKEYFEQQYSPGNITLVASGQIDFDQLVKQAEESCGSWSPFEVEREIEAFEPSFGYDSIYKEQSVQEYILQLAPGPASEDENRFASRVMATIMGDDSGSRMFWEFIDPGIAEYAGMGVYEYQGAGLIMSVLCCEPHRTNEHLQRLNDLHVAMQRDGVTDHELELAKRKIYAHVILQSERPESRLFAIGANWLQRGEYRTVKEIAEAYQNVSMDDVRAIIDQYPLTNSFTLGVGPLKDLTAPTAT